MIPVVDGCARFPCRDCSYPLEVWTNARLIDPDGLGAVCGECLPAALAAVSRAVQVERARSQLALVEGGTA